MSFDQFFEVNGIRSDTFPIKLYLDNLKFKNEDNRYENNLAAHFLKIHRKRTDAENSFINTVLKRRFNKSKSIQEKKYIAELLLHYDHSCHRIFNWYAKLLLNDDSTTISEFLTHNNMHYCNSLFAVQSLKKLFQKYGNRTNDKSMAIRSIIYDSATNIIKDSAFRKISFAVIMNMLQHLHKTMNSDTILRLQLRCINEYTSLRNTRER